MEAFGGTTFFGLWLAVAFMGWSILILRKEHEKLKSELRSLRERSELQATALQNVASRLDLEERSSAEVILTMNRLREDISRLQSRKPRLSPLAPDPETGRAYGRRPR